MDLSKKSKSFMISDILTVPLNLSSTCSGRSSDSDKASAVLQFTSSGHVDHQIPDRKNTSPPSSAVIDKGRDSDIRRISPPITQKSIPKLVAPIGMRQTQFGSQILMQNCLFPTGFHDYGKIKSFGLGNEFRAGHTISPEQKSLAGCFCSMPYCSAPNLGVPCPDPLGFDHDAAPVPIPIPLYVRTRFSNAADLLKAKRCRRSRTVFTELQLMGLEKKFETQKYLSTPDRVELADRLGLSQIQVKTWYQNRRMKWKKQVMQDGGTEPPTKPKGRPKKSFLVAAAASANESKARETTLVANVTIETDCHENIFVDDDSDSVIPDI